MSSADEFGFRKHTEQYQVDINEAINNDDVEAAVEVTLSANGCLHLMQLAYAGYFVRG